MFKILLTVLKRKKYFLIALTTSLIMAALSHYLTVKNIYKKSIFIYAEMNGGLFTVASVILGLIIAALFGSYVALLIFRRNITKKQVVGDKTAGAGGAAASLLASGCPSCGAPILGLMGLPLGLFSLPLRGLELKILSIGLLLLSVHLISKNIKNSLICEKAVK